MEQLPEVASDAATLSVGSDSYPYTVVHTLDGHVWVQRDEYKPASGSDYYFDQKYEYYRNFNSKLEHYTLRKNGRYVLKGQPAHGSALHIGRRCAYSDPSF